jgi:hypothetical protein
MATVLGGDPMTPEQAAGCIELAPQQKSQVASPKWPGLILD